MNNKFIITCFDLSQKKFVRYRIEALNWQDLVDCKLGQFQEYNNSCMNIFKIELDTRSLPLEDW